MSLTNFIKRPRISKAFDEFASKKRTPAEFKGMECLVRDFEGPNGLAGTAFDYLARMKIVREFRESKIELHQREWLSEKVLRSLPGHPEFSHEPYFERERWQTHLEKAHSAANAYIRNEGCPTCLTLNVQYMAQADLLHRNSWAFDIFFNPAMRVAHELECLLELFKPGELFRPKKSIFLNPAFALSVNIGGADADLIVDNRLIDIKMSKQLLVTKSQLLQLAGYKILADLGGLDIADRPHQVQIDRLGVHFPRYNALFEMEVEELFPGGAYEKFKAVFEEELHIVEKKFLEQQRQWDEFVDRTRESRIAGNDSDLAMR